MEGSDHGEEDLWEGFWAGILQRADGSIDIDQLKRELHDFSLLIKSVSIVYSAVTGGVVSKPLTDPYAVIRQFEEYVRLIVDDELEDAMDAPVQDVLELRADVLGRKEERERQVR